MTRFLFLFLLKLVCLLFLRQHPWRLKGPFLHWPVWARTPEAPRGQPPAVGWPLLPGRQPHSEERRCQAAAGSQCRHPSSGSAWTLRHRPGEAGRGERPAKETSANGEQQFLKLLFWHQNVNGYIHDLLWILQGAEFNAFRAIQFDWWFNAIWYKSRILYCADVFSCDDV